MNWAWAPGHPAGTARVERALDGSRLADTLPTPRGGADGPQSSCLSRTESLLGRYGWGAGSAGGRVRLTASPRPGSCTSGAARPKRQGQMYREASHFSGAQTAGRGKRGRGGSRLTLFPHSFSGTRHTSSTRRSMRKLHLVRPGFVQSSLSFRLVPTSAVSPRSLRYGGTCFLFPIHTPSPASLGLQWRPRPSASMGQVGRRQRPGWGLVRPFSDKLARNVHRGARIRASHSFAERAGRPEYDAATTGLRFARLTFFVSFLPPPPPPVPRASSWPVARIPAPTKTGEAVRPFLRPASGRIKASHGLAPRPQWERRTLSPCPLGFYRIRSRLHVAGPPPHVVTDCGCNWPGQVSFATCHAASEKYRRIDADARSRDAARRATSGYPNAPDLLFRFTQRCRMRRVCGPV